MSNSGIDMSEDILESPVSVQQNHSILFHKDLVDGFLFEYTSFVIYKYFGNNK